MAPEEIKAWENTIGSFMCMGAASIIVLAFAIDIFKGRD